MKHLITLTLAILIFFPGVINAQTTVKGLVKDADSGLPLPGVTVQVVGGNISTSTNEVGEFIIPSINQGSYLFSFNLNGYQYIEQPVELASDEVTLPEVLMHRAQTDEAQNQTFSEVTISSDELEDESKDQSVSGLLQSSQDAYSNAVAYTFSPARFQIRGYDSDYSLVYMNGIPINDPESGFASWSSWGGLNDATRNRESRNGLAPTNFSFGGLGGASNISTRATQARVGTRVSYASTNRMYRNRIMFTHSTGLMENGVALTLSGSRRWAEEGYVEGTSYDAWAYFIAVEKKFSNRHYFNFTTFNAPTKRTMAGAATEEVNKLTGTNYYNPNWGYQNGEKRNARLRNQEEPTFILNHYWNINDNMKLTTAASFSFGTYSTTSLNWYDAQDPRPDYYRKLPSYNKDSDSSSYALIIDAFKNDVNTRQLDWDYLYQTNYGSLDTSTNTLRSKYILENRITDSKQYTLNSVLNWDLKTNLKINGGFELSLYRGRNYKTIYDLLGGNYWLDIDQFAERDFGESDLMQNDLDNPNRMVKEGDTFGYDYTANVNNVSLWAVGNYMLNQFDLYLGGNLSLTQFWRTGSMRNGRFPTESKGDSEKMNFENFGVKGGATWKISGRHYLDANAAYLTRAPFFRYSYISPRTSNRIIPNITDERILSADINYNVRTPFVKARLTGYYTKFMDQTELKSFYHDSYNTFINYSIFGIDKVHKGIEVGAEVKATTTITINAALALGSYQYASRPKVTITMDNSGSLVAENQVVYIKNFYIPNTPQTAATLGIRYASPKYWFLGANVSYFADTYIDFNPEKRTAEMLIGLEPNDPLREQITQQIGVPSQYLVDVNIGKSWRIEYKYFLNLNFQIANLLDNTSFRTGGYEQLRYAGTAEDQSQFPPRYYYAFGRTYYLILGFRF